MARHLTQVVALIALVCAFVYMGVGVLFGWLLREHFGADTFTMVAVAFSIATLVFVAAGPCTVWLVTRDCPSGDDSENQADTETVAQMS